MEEVDDFNKSFFNLSKMVLSKAIVKVNRTLRKEKKKSKYYSKPNL